MPKTSSYIDVSETLRAQLTTAFLGTKVAVMRAAKLDRTPADWIAIGGISGGSHVIPTMRAGRKARQEEYDLIIGFTSVRGGSDSLPAEQAVMDLVDKLENILADDPAIGLAGDPDYVGLYCEMGEYDLDIVYDEQRGGWRAVMTVRVHVSVRLR